MTSAFVTPRLIRWARERRRLSPVRAAEELDIRADLLHAWESGEKKPSLRQAQGLAKKLHVPLGYLFLSAPPQEETSLPDLRTIGDRNSGEFSPELRDVVNDALRKQFWLREYRQEEGATALPFVGRFRQQKDPSIIAADIRETLQIDREAREMASGWEAFLRELVRAAEDVGVLVLRNGIVGNNTTRPLDVEEFRGFASIDEFAPLVFLNARDALAAQIFTLAHELAHVWIGVPGISNPDFKLRSADQTKVVERLCNKVAAELLLPRHEFLEDWRDSRSLDANMRTIARHFRVSNLVVLRQALDLEKVSPSVYWKQFKLELLKYTKPRSDDDEGGGDFYASLFVRNSRSFTEALLTATAEGRVLYRDAAQLLSVKVRTLDGISERLFGEPILGG